MTDTTQAAGLTDVKKLTDALEAYATAVHARAQGNGSSSECHRLYNEVIRAALAAQAVPAGYRLVPEEPTHKMLEAGKMAHWQQWGDNSASAQNPFRCAWSAMIAASPAPAGTIGNGQPAATLEFTDADGVHPWIASQIDRAIGAPDGWTSAQEAAPAEAKEEPKRCDICGEGKTTLVKLCDHCGSVYADAKTYATPQPQAAQPVPQSAAEAFRNGKLVEAVARAICFADSGSTDDWEGATDLAQAAINVCNARNPPRCSHCHSSTSQPAPQPQAAQPVAMTDEREAFEYAFLSANGFHTKAELAQEWEKGLSGVMFRAGLLAQAAPNVPEAKAQAVPVARVTELVGAIRIEAECLPHHGERMKIGDMLYAAPQPPAPSEQRKPLTWNDMNDSIPPKGTDCLVLSQEPWEKAPTVKLDRWDEIHEAPVSFSSATIYVGDGWVEDHTGVTHWMPIPGVPDGIRSTGGEHE